MCVDGAEVLRGRGDNFSNYVKKSLLARSIYPSSRRSPKREKSSRLGCRRRSVAGGGLLNMISVLIVPCAVMFTR